MLAPGVHAQRFWFHWDGIKGIQQGLEQWFSTDSDFAPTQGTLGNGWSSSGLHSSGRDMCCLFLWTESEQGRS